MRLIKIRRSIANWRLHVKLVALLFVKCVQCALWCHHQGRFPRWHWSKMGIGDVNAQSSEGWNVSPGESFNKAFGSDAAATLVHGLVPRDVATDFNHFFVSGWFRRFWWGMSHFRKTKNCSKVWRSVTCAHCGTTVRMYSDPHLSCHPQDWRYNRGDGVSEAAQFSWNNLVRIKIVVWKSHSLWIKRKVAFITDCLFLHTRRTEQKRLNRTTKA